MEVNICVEGKLLEEISVENGLRQGCCMAPVLFNLYTCLVMEHWAARVEEHDGVGIQLKYKMDISCSESTPEMLNRGRSLSACLLMMELFSPPHEPVLRVQSWNINQSVKGFSSTFSYFIHLHTPELFSTREDTNKLK